MQNVHSKKENEVIKKMKVQKAVTFFIIFNSYK